MKHCGVSKKPRKLTVELEPDEDRNFKNLQDAGGSQGSCKEGLVIVIGQLMDRRTLSILGLMDRTFKSVGCTPQIRSGRIRYGHVCGTLH